MEFRQIGRLENQKRIVSSASISYCCVDAVIRQVEGSVVDRDDGFHNGTDSEASGSKYIFRSLYVSYRFVFSFRVCAASSQRTKGR